MAGKVTTERAPVKRSPDRGKEPISDRQLAAVLRPFVRAAGPVVGAMRAPGRLGGLGSVKVPGSAAWQALAPQDRTIWWINRVGRLTALVAAIPGLGGVLADRLPIQDALGASAQGLLLCAIAEEHGVRDLGERVRLLAWVLFDRDLDPALAVGKDDEVRERASGRGPGIVSPEDSQASKKARAEELAGEFAGNTKRRMTVLACSRTLWRMARSLTAIPGELEKRPRGYFFQRGIGMLPIVGMVGNYLAERSALKRVASMSAKWLASRRA